MSATAIIALLGLILAATLAACASPSRTEPTTTAAATAAIEATLNDFHDAASKADAPRYFAHFAPEGVFIGTDATERWNVKQFRAFAQPYFSQGKGWTYTPTIRHIDILPGGTAAYFDELLTNEKYGICRGTGVLRVIDGQWKISQYHLTKPVPNEAMEKVVELLGGQ